MTTPYANYFVIIMGYFRPFYHSMRTEIITFFRTLLFSELYCRIPCNSKYIHLFLIGSWTTTSWRIYHQAFSVTIPSWNGCKSGVFLNIGVWATHGIQPSKETFECVGDIAYLGYLLIKRYYHIFIWNMYRLREIRLRNRSLKKKLWGNVLKETLEEGISPLDPSLPPQLVSSSSQQWSSMRFSVHVFVSVFFWLFFFACRVDKNKKKLVQWHL